MSTALKPVFELLYSRFERLALKGEPIERGATVTEEEVAAIFDEVKGLLGLPDLAREDLKRKHLEGASKFKEFWEVGVWVGGGK